FYDRIADVHNLAMKVNGYRSSVSRYLKSLDLEIGPESLVLDAGSGTGVVTLGFHDAGYTPRNIIALDLSYKSLRISRDQFAKRSNPTNSTLAVQGDILDMPFEDESFDLILMCGVLEYLPVDEGLRESARVLKKGSPLILLPVRQSVVGSVLELIYKFRIRPLEHFREAAAPYFDVVDNHNFPITEPIGWSKTSMVLKKK
ncbi:MAG: class I SAM-dependent methyltransferase, partial [Pyrinomonadaceae bacterium]